MTLIGRVTSLHAGHEYKDGISRVNVRFEGMDPAYQDLRFKQINDHTFELDDEVRFDLRRETFIA